MKFLVNNCWLILNGLMFILFLSDIFYTFICCFFGAVHIYNVYIQFDWILKALICFTSYFNIIQFHLFLHIYLRKSMYFSVYCFHRMLTTLCSSSVQFHSNSIHTYSHSFVYCCFTSAHRHISQRLGIAVENRIACNKTKKERERAKEKTQTNWRQTEEEIDWNWIEKEANKILKELNEVKHTIK